ncbi:hypothetical protein WBQ28_05715 [Pseudomonas syringae pv. syringae]|uniref:hypothetical protein n=1 Tax=Pseudomonas syringae TaxID=317 RepID=UPI003B00101B
MSNIELSLDDVPVLIDIESIVSRPGFKAPLYFVPSHEDRNFGKIIAPYHLKGKMIKCGIADCGKPHLHGYSITTSDGLETNIGKDCGTKHFKANFSAEMKRHDELYNRRLKVNRIVKLKESAPELLERILLAQSDYLFLKSLRHRLRGALSSADSQRIERKLKTRDPAIYKYVDRTAAEKEAYFEANPSSRKTGMVPPHQIKTGEILGFAFLDANYRDEEAFNLIAPLRAIINATNKEIALWRSGMINKSHSWIGGSEKHISRVEDLIKSGNEFFSHENILKLASVGIDESSIEAALTDIKKIMREAGRPLA